MDLDDNRWMALWRYRDDVVENVTSCFAICRMIASDRELFWNLQVRQHAQMTRLLHQICFNLRKAIELVEREAVGTISQTKATCVHSSGKTMVLNELLPDETVTLSDKSFWWIVCRMIHSIETTIRTSTINTDINSRGRFYCTYQLTYFGFRSDFDEDTTMHYIKVEDFLYTYLQTVDPILDQAIKAQKTKLFKKT